jgi:hypothetical protein
MIYVKDVESIVKNLIGNNLGEFSENNIMNDLKNDCIYKQKARSKILLFDENEVWNNYFMRNGKLKTMIEKRKIISVQELMLYIED